MKLLLSNGEASIWRIIAIPWIPRLRPALLFYTLFQTVMKVQFAKCTQGSAVLLLRSLTSAIQSCIQTFLFNFEHDTPFAVMTGLSSKFAWRLRASLLTVILYYSFESCHPRVTVECVLLSLLEPNLASKDEKRSLSIITCQWNSYTTIKKKYLKPELLLLVQNIILCLFKSLEWEVIKIVYR